MGQVHGRLGQVWVGSKGQVHGKLGQGHGRALVLYKQVQEGHKEQVHGRLGQVWVVCKGQVHDKQVQGHGKVQALCKQVREGHKVLVHDKLHKRGFGGKLHKHCKDHGRGSDLQLFLRVDDQHIDHIRLDFLF